MTLLADDQLHRAAGVLLTMAAGDALGAGYEFSGPYPQSMQVEMKGGGAFGWAPGEWTDDTQMALVIAAAANQGADLREAEVLDSVAAGWVDWLNQATDVGAQTRSVLAAVARRDRATADALLEESAGLHARSGHTAGNGSLMRTAPVALAHLRDPSAITDAATTLSRLTHYDPEAAEACVLWCHLIRHAVLTGELDPAPGLQELSIDASEVWARRLEDASHMVPADFSSNGWVVEALQAAWCAIVTTGDPADGDATHVRRALEAAVRGGRDTDTVAAIAGGLLGGLYGASAVPAAWRRVLHGWPGLRARDLISLAVLLSTGGMGDASGWPLEAAVDYRGYSGRQAFAVHPHDDGVLLGGIGQLNPLPASVDAVVSLCRLGAEQVPAAGVAPEDHVEVWLVDSSRRVANPNLQFVLADTAEVLADLRAEGKTVLLHCVQAQSRTPTVAALYAVGLGIPGEQALADVCSALPHAQPNPAFKAALQGLGSGQSPHSD